MRFLRISMRLNLLAVATVTSMVTVLTLLATLFPSSAWSTERAATNLAGLTHLSIEELAETEVISAAHFARQVVDAPSAVSVVTAEEIRRFGYRTIAEILDSMRGIHITRDRDYSYLGGRGYGGGGYAGRIMILIDGYSAVENFFNQIFIAEDGYLDTALIERVEYAPGPGSAIYGNNAFLGVINIVTRKGRDFDGLDTELTVGSHGERESRVTGGKRFDNGAEWLISASRLSSDGVHHYHDGETRSNADLLGERLFLKGSHRNWSLEAASADKWRDNDEEPFLGGFYRYRDRNRFINIGHEADLGLNWRTATRLYYGDYLFGHRSHYDDGGVYSSGVDGRWYGIDGKLIYLGFDRHQVLFGGEYRIDAKQDTHDSLDDGINEPLERASHDNGDTFSLYGEDLIALMPSLSASIGGRYDRRRYRSRDMTYSAFNPRLAFIYTPWDALTLKLSHGQASRFFSTDEQNVFEGAQPSRVRTTELVAEHVADNHRLIGSLYRYHVDRLPESSEVQSQDIQGAELESEWQWPGGKTLRLSYAWQSAEDDLGREMPNVPRNIGKLQLSMPLVDERLRASLALRYVGEHQGLQGQSVDGYTLTDLTLTSLEPLPGTTLSLGVRNLLDTEYSHVAYLGGDDGLLAQDGRTVWLRLGYQFQ